MTCHYDASAFTAAPDAGNAPASETRSMVWLRGQPHLEDYLAFYRKKVIGGDKVDQRMLTARWREANDLYHQLEEEEGGIADTIACRPLDRRLAGLAAKLEANQWFRRSFDNLPYSIELVELDKLIVSQIQVENGFSRGIAARLGPKPTPAQLFRFCLPLERELAPVKIQRLSSNRYQFSSPSSDFRAHDPVLLRDLALGEFSLSGPAAAHFGISVGFGSNFLSAIRSGSRVVLQNGYHRAHALRSAGLTHAWCVVEEVTRKDELRLSATEEVLADPAFYFLAKRPPILRDFFDPRIAEEVLTKPTDCLVEIEINVRSTTVTSV
jgi:hypothetical protein